MYQEAAMADSFSTFDSRLKRIERSHRNFERGYTAVVGADGLITIKAKRPKRSLPVKGMVLLVLGFLCFKALMLAHLGPDAYVERVAELQAGTIVEQVGGFVMQADPATQLIATQIGPFMR